MSLKQSILIVDDEPNILNLIKDGLSMYDDRLDVLTASTAEEALRIIENHRVALLTTDIRMPGMDGFGLISHVQRKYPETRFIVMTAYATDESIQRSRKYGVIDYIKKPFQFEEFAQKVFQALKPPKGFWAGRLHGFQLTDALQLVHLVGKSQTIRVSTEFGENCLIYMSHGEIVHAVLEDLEGEEAFFKIIALEGGEIESLAFPEGVPTTIQRPLGALILEGMRRKDEAEATEKWGGEEFETVSGEAGLPETARAEASKESLLHPPAQPVPGQILGGAFKATGQVISLTEEGGEMEGVEESPQESAASSSSEFYRLVDEGFDRYRKGELEAARECWEKALELRPDDKAVRFNLGKLTEKEKQSR
jgi:CheY-like chemotaxis protein